MARPKKNNAEYFSHDADMRNDLRIRALRNRYGLNGYAVYNLLLEVLADAENFRIPWNPVQRELLSGDFGIDNALLEEIVSYMTDVLALFTLKDDILFSPSLLKRMQPLLDQRLRWRRNKSAAENSPAPQIPQRNNSPQKTFSAEKTPQRKGKQRKEKQKEVAAAEPAPHADEQDFIGTLFLRCFSRLPNLADRMITEQLITAYGREPTEKAFLKARGNLGEKITLAYIRGIVSGESNGNGSHAQKISAPPSAGMGYPPFPAGAKSSDPSSSLTGRWEQYIRENPPQD